MIIIIIIIIIIITLLSAFRVVGECGLESTDHFIKRKQKERKDEWSQKVMHGQFIRQTADVADTKRWLWTQKGYLKIESLSTAALDQALRTNLAKTKIDKSQNDPTCRMCKTEGERVMHIISGCSKVVQKESGHSKTRSADARQEKERAELLISPYHKTLEWKCRAKMRSLKSSEIQ